jgi:hypothetical protein
VAPARAAGALALILAATAAIAQDGPRFYQSANISVGREGRLAYYAAPDATCRKNAVPKIEVVGVPSYGKLAFRPERLMAHADVVPPQAYGCLGQFVDATAVFYKPAARYRGTDRAVLRITFPSADGTAVTRTDEIFISVR